MYTSSMFDRAVKKKTLFFVLIFIGASLMFLLMTLPSPLLNDFVHETHKKLNKLNTGVSFNNKNKENKRPRLADSELDKAYLELLGFVTKPVLYPYSTVNNVRLPVIVTAATSENYENTFSLLATIQKYLQNYTLVIYDLGLESYETLKIKEVCILPMNCQLRHFDFDKFPSHIKNYLYTQAYLPILLQQAMTDYGCLIWVGMETEEHFISGNLNMYIDLANQSGGLLGWALDSQEPTSVYTHPSMFSKFDTLPPKYYFHRMLETSHLILINTYFIHKEIMLPWIQCCLSQSCLAPTGSEPGRSCNKRKPRYLYSGCHRYAMSALNVVLGRCTKDGDQSYLRTNKSELFGRELVTNAKQLLFSYQVTLAPREVREDGNDEYNNKHF